MLNNISIIIPTYNNKHLLTCLNSVVNQTVPFAQVIIIDDCSTDNTINICKQYEQKYNNIQYIQLNNHYGINHARQIGLQLAHTEYVGFLNATDILDINYVAVLTQLLNTTVVDMIYFNIAINNTENVYCNNLQYNNKLNNKLLTGMDYISLYPFLKANYGLNYIIKKDIFIKNDIKFLNVDYNADFVFSVKCQLFANNILFIDNVLYTKNIYSDDILTAPIDDIRIEKMTKPLLILWQWIKKHKNLFDENTYKVFPFVCTDMVLDTIKYQKQDEMFVVHHMVKLYNHIIKYFGDPDLNIIYHYVNKHLSDINAKTTHKEVFDQFI